MRSTPTRALAQLTPREREGVAACLVLALGAAGVAVFHRARENALLAGMMAANSVAWALWDLGVLRQARQRE